MHSHQITNDICETPPSRNSRLPLLKEVTAMPNAAKKSPPKPREFRSEKLAIRAECVVVEGERIIDTSLSLFDDATCAADLKRYSQWLVRAAAWVAAK